MKKCYQKAICLFLLIAFLSSKVNAQLAAGDMVVLGIDAVNDKITFATLVDIPAGTEIKITDRGWDNSTQAFTTATTGDGTVTWIPTANTDAGTIFSLVLGGADNAPASSLTNVTTNTNLTSQTVFSGYSVNDPLVATGDQVFIYKGSDTNPYFIFGLNASGNINLDANYWQTMITLTLPQSTLPNGAGSQNSLTSGVNAVGILTNPGGGTSAQQQFDNVFYSGPTGLGNKATWLARIANKDNWGGDDSGFGLPSVGTTLGTSEIALPAIFNRIAVTGTAGKYTLSWQTLSETDNAYFEVQASPDGAGFATVATVKSLAMDGNSDTPLQYNISFDLAEAIALSGLGLLSLLLLGFPGKKRKWMVLAAVCTLSTAWYGCTKSNREIDTSQTKVYLRIAQVNKDGGKNYSKVIVVNAEQ